MIFIFVLLQYGQFTNFILTCSSNLALEQTMPQTDDPSRNVNHIVSFLPIIIIFNKYCYLNYNYNIVNE